MPQTDLHGASFLRAHRQRQGIPRPPSPGVRHEGPANAARSPRAAAEIYVRLSPRLLPMRAAEPREAYGSVLTSVSVVVVEATNQSFSRPTRDSLGAKRFNRVAVTAVGAERYVAHASVRIRSEGETCDDKHQTRRGEDRREARASHATTLTKTRRYQQLLRADSRLSPAEPADASCSQTTRIGRIEPRLA